MNNMRSFLMNNVRCVQRHLFRPPTILMANRSTSTATTTIPSPPLSVPVPDGADRPINPKLQKLVTEISQLNLLEVAELSGLLKKTLNLPDAPMMPMGGFAMGGAGGGGSAAAADEDEEVAPKKTQTAFKVKLMKFDDKQKVALIKEIKSLLEGMNLVQAKKFVESAPTIVKEDLPKDEAEKLRDALQKVGAVIEIE